MSHVKCTWCGKDLARITGKYPNQHFFCDKSTCMAPWLRSRREASGITKEWLTKKYVVEKLSCKTIALILGRCRLSIERWLHDYGIPVRSLKRGWSLKDKIAAAVKKQPESGCWIWTGSTVGSKKNWYGKIWHEGKTLLSHRASYETFVGPVPPGLTIDHLCRNPACVNPEHLEPVTQRENALRGIGITAINSKKTTCLRGHALAGENLKIKVGRDKGLRRTCRQCSREQQRERRAASRLSTENNNGA